MNLLPWIGFIALVLALLALDLGVLHKRASVITPVQALRWTAIWVGVAVAWNVCMYFLYEQHFLGIGATIGHKLTGKQAAMQFFSAYVVEESLSIDNLFVMLLIFNYFAVPAAYQHRVLFFGILGAIVFRGIFIGAGLAFINQFTWATYAFGALLVYTAGKLLLAGGESVKPEESVLVRLLQKHLPLTSDYRGEKFFVIENGNRYATPLCVALALIESSDIVFAVDSVPAVFGVTRDPFVAFTSNVFAILGLRSLYFALAAAMHAFRFMKLSLVCVLGFVGLKMLLAHHLQIGTLVSLGVIVGFLAIGVFASLLVSSRS